ncbi:MAG: MarR family transcriptional regulator [Crocinitomicaceae bacterium]|nr:MarR family transcriptional regulator [Crocinitomicaceae bacterium]|tara:strand:+ start:12202 stop:13239 length:1038 start_codon:yes stop_codon:yes gene_type:complete
MNKVHTLILSIEWNLISIISKIDRFDAEWSSIEKKEGQSLKELKSIATVRSVGASTRIEGSKMSNEEVDVLLKDLSIEKLEDRDSQEVAGYFEVMDIISGSFGNIDITENSIKNLHNQLLKYSEKDAWHRGDYKQLSNSVEATLANGTKQVIFQTTPPAIETNKAMESLIEWYHNDQETHPLVKSAIFCYEFVSIHPFQDGNGRLSRLLSSLLLLNHGYKWIQYVSLEHEIESRKTEYYQKLRDCQAQRPNEDVSQWIDFFFDGLLNIQEQLKSKLETQGIETKLSPKEKSILHIIGDNAGIKSGQIAKRLDIPSPTVKRILSHLVSQNLIEKFGTGPGTNYSIK